MVVCISSDSLEQSIEDSSARRSIQLDFILPRRDSAEEVNTSRTSIPAISVEGDSSRGEENS